MSKVIWFSKVLVHFKQLFYYVREVMLNIVSKRWKAIYTFTNTWNSLKHCTAMLTEKYVYIKSNLYFKSLGTSSQKHNTIYIMNVIFISFKTPLPPPLLHRGKPYPVPPTTTKYKNIPTIHSSAFNSKTQPVAHRSNVPMCIPLSTKQQKLGIGLAERKWWKNGMRSKHSTIYKKYCSFC